MCVRGRNKTTTKCNAVAGEVAMNESGQLDDYKGEVSTVAQASECAQPEFAHACVLKCGAPE